MLVPADRVAAIARSGWVPASMVCAVTVTIQLLSGTSARDFALFSAYASFCLVLPGTLAWRLLRPIPTRLWLEDVVFGAILGYAIEIPVYLLARLSGRPLLVLLWPLAVYVYALGTRHGRSLWRPSGRIAMTPQWSWPLAGIFLYLVLYIARANWWVTSVSGPGLRDIGPDASFQLALTGELRHHVPPSIPWVSGEPLHYHWLTYAHTASATWVTSIEPIIMLRRLAPLLMAALVVLAVVALAYRLTRRPSIGLLGGALLVLVHSPAFYATGTDHFQRQEFTSAALFGSPTMTFGALLFCGVLVLVFDVLRQAPPRSAWPLLALLMAASAGAKATFPPMVTAGLLGVLVVGTVTRSLSRRHVALLALAAVVWLTFQFGFYGGEDTGARLTPRGTFDFAATSFGARVPETWSVSALALGVVVVLLWAVHMAGMLGLLHRGGWRSPVHVFLIAFMLSGLGASLLLDLGAGSQQWFVSSTQVPSAVGAAVGFSRVFPEGSARVALPVVIPAGLLGLLGMALGWALTPGQVPEPGPTLARLWAYAAPFLLTVAVILGAAALAHRSRSGLRSPGLVFVIIGLTSLGLFRTVQVTAQLARVPWERPSLPAARETAVGRAGVEASRWLREHSGENALIATNGHTLTPSSDLNLAFWLAGYAERRILVESWGYTPHHARIMADSGLRFDDVPFWDLPLLKLNDRSFTNPTRARLTKLSDVYGVDWLVADRRFPSSVGALDQLLPVAFRKGDYVVYSMIEK